MLGMKLSFRVCTNHRQNKKKIKDKTHVLFPQMSRSIQDEAIQTLTCLGLNLSQARVYFALVQKEISTAKQISKFSGVNRQEIYRIMPKLIKLGLATKMISVPTRWKATPIRNGLSILLESKKKETSELHKKATKIINNLNGNNKRANIQEEEYSFSIISEKLAIKNWIPKRLAKTHTSNDVITIMKTFNKVMYVQGEALIEAAKRGVKLRLIVYKTENEEALPQIVKFTNNANIHIKFVTGKPLGIMAIQDKKFVIINTDLENGLGPSLVSNNPALIRMLSNHFDLLWQKI